MFKAIQSFFIWSAGSDETLLKDCTESERIKHAGYGALVWIPAIVGLFSMTYAVSTLTENPFCYCLAGLAWSFIVFNVDRFIVSTARKTITVTEKDLPSENDRQPHENGTADKTTSNPVYKDYVYDGDAWKDARSASFIIRFIFAAFVGIIVAHPVVLLTFRKSINKELDQMHLQQAAEMDNTCKRKIDSINVREKREYVSEQRDLKERIHAQEQLYNAEVAADVARGRGLISGLYGKGPAAAACIQILDSLKAEQKALKLEHQPQLEAIDREIQALKAENDTLKAREAKNNDYLMRETALAHITAKEPIIKITQYLLIFFFVLLDILPVTLKTFTPIGKYDIVLDHERRSITPWAYGDDGIKETIKKLQAQAAQAAEEEKAIQQDFIAFLNKRSAARAAKMNTKLAAVIGGTAKLEEFDNEFGYIFGKIAAKAYEAATPPPPSGPVQKTKTWQDRMRSLGTELTLHSVSDAILTGSLTLAGIIFQYVDYADFARLQGFLEKVHKG